MSDLVLIALTKTQIFYQAVAVTKDVVFGDDHGNKWAISLTTLCFKISKPMSDNNQNIPQYNIYKVSAGAVLPKFPRQPEDLTVSAYTSLNHKDELNKFHQNYMPEAGER